MHWRKRHRTRGCSKASAFCPCAHCRDRTHKTQQSPRGLPPTQRHSQPWLVQECVFGDDSQLPARRLLRTQTLVLGAGNSPCSRPGRERCDSEAGGRRDSGRAGARLSLLRALEQRADTPRPRAASPARRQPRAGERASVTGAGETSACLVLRLGGVRNSIVQFPPPSCLPAQTQTYSCWQKTAVSFGVGNGAVSRDFSLLTRLATCGVNHSPLPSQVVSPKLPEPDTPP